MSKIQRLSLETINQIAAGEVIENPSSVIKELVENSIDAGATRVFVEIENGGQTFIRIQDNGCGMSEEDALLSIERHATSKLRSHDDLEAIATMGFRGEALAAVASISELTIRTAEKKSDAPIQVGCELVVHGSQVVSFTPTECFPGTDITVKSLFYNVPARKKFQKAPSKDAFDVIKSMTQLAIAHPEVEFELIVNKKREFLLAEKTLEARIKALLGQEYASSLKPIVYEEEGLKIEGYIGSHTASKPNRSGQWLFLNRRPILSLPISYGVKEGFGTSLDKDRHPIFVLHLTVAGDNVDVNVHPQKKEVRFRQEEELKNRVRDQVSSTLFSHAPRYVAQETYAEPVRAPVYIPNSTYLPPARSFNNEPVSFDFEEEAPAYVAYSAPAAPLTTHFELPSFHIVGVYQEYIFADMTLDNEVGLFIIDGKRALQRITFEDLLAKKESKVASQQLIAPISLQLSPHEAAALSELLPVFQTMGFEIREFGRAAFLIESAPSHMHVSELEPFFKEAVKEEEEDPVKRMRKLARVASYHVLSKRNPLTESLAKEILRRLLVCESPRKCPNGDNIFAPLSREDIQKKFL